MIRRRSPAVIGAALVLALVGAGRPARAGGWDVWVQSPAAAGIAGAGTAARAEEPDAAYYAPAGLAMQRGFAVAGAVTTGMWSAHAQPPRELAVDSPLQVRALGNAYLTQRFGPYVALGVGAYTPFAWRTVWPAGWAGARGGERFAVEVYGVSPAVALRPLPWLSVGAGMTVFAASVAWDRGNPDGTPGGVRSSTKGTGVGAHVSVVVRAVPRWLTIAATYRSSADLDTDGTGSIDAPGTPSIARDAKLTLFVPHQLSLGVATRPLAGLTVAVDAHASFWQDAERLSRTLHVPGTDEADDVVDRVDLGRRPGVAVRAGVEYRVPLPRERGALPLRLGVGVDTTPVKRGWLTPVQIDGLRAVAGVGLGYSAGSGWLAVDAGYTAEIMPSRTSTNPLSPIAFDAVTHLLSIGITLRLVDVGGGVRVPEYKR
jgi:long-subunit fatty acid transport protein